MKLLHSLLFIAFIMGVLRAGDAILYIGDFGIPHSLDPITATKQVEHHLCQFVFDSLVVPINDGDFSLSMAKELDISPDGLSYTFVLHNNISWADKTPVTSQDIQFTIALLSHPQTQNYDATLAKYIEDVICINPQAVTIVLAKPFYRPLALFTFKILPKHKFRHNYLQHTHAFAKSPLGCGPFQYGKRTRRYVVLHRNHAFRYRRQPFFDKVIVRFYANKQRAIKDFLAKKIHLLTEIAPRDIATLQHREGIVLHKYHSRTIDFIAFNHRAQHRYHELFSDYRFRRALLHAIDREGIIDKISHVDAEKTSRENRSYAIISGPFPANSWAYDKNISPFAYNNAYARQLLREVLTRKNYQLGEDGLWYKGNKQHIGLQLKCADDDRDIVNACKQIVSAWKKLGLIATLQLQREKDFFQDIYHSHNFDTVYTQYAFDQTLNVFPLFDPQRTKAGQSNFSGYVDPKLIELFYRKSNTLNPWALRSICHKIHQLVHKDTVHLFLWQLARHTAHRQILKNIKLHPYYLFNFPEKWRLVSE